MYLLVHFFHFLTMPPPSTLPLILPLASALVILPTHIVLYQFFDVFYLGVSFMSPSNSSCFVS